MTPEPLEAMEVALALAAALDAKGVSYAIGGALALGLWGLPRGTVDVDLNVFVDEGSIAEVVEILRQVGAIADPQQALDASRADGMFVARIGPMRVDVFTPSIPFSWEAERTRASVEVSGQRAWFLSAEATAVFKMLFFRAKDIADLQRLIAVQGGRLDTAYVRRWLVDMVGEDDDRIPRWDRLVADHQ